MKTKPNIWDSVYDPFRDQSWEEFQAQEVALDKAMEYALDGRL